MIDHIGIGATDIAASRRFYDAALGAMGIDLMIEVTPEQSGGYHGVGYGKGGKPFFWLAADGPRGAGIHVAFSVAHRAEVNAFYRAALKCGGRGNGAPGIRPYYHPDYYAAFIFDPDGINVEAVCHVRE